MPGDSTSARADAKSAAPRSTIGRPARAAASRFAAASSQAMTAAPPRCSEAADARPERARPSTATFWLRNWVTSIIGSPQLQRGEPGDRQDRSDDPEADDDCRLLPALLLEMMVQWRHAEDAPAGELEARDLDDDRNRLQHEQAADDGEHQLVLGDDADRAQGAADGERAGIAHENHGRWRVEPEEAQRRAHHRRAAHRPT